MDEITIGDKVYVSSKRAAKITGYAKDYVGQLCREGRVEARLVGRNWYVLESAIREHRFGASTQQEEPVRQAEEVKEPEDRSSTWQKPAYAAEIPPAVPELIVKPTPEPIGSPAIADMQSAWREWFADKKPVEALSDGSSDFKDEYLPVIIPEETINASEEEAVLLNRLDPQVNQEIKEEEETIEIHKFYASRETGEQVPVTSVPMVDLTNLKKSAAMSAKNDISAKRTESSSVAIRAILLTIAFAAILIAIVGTGNAEQFITGTSLDFGVQKSILDFLDGTSSYKSSI